MKLSKIDGVKQFLTLRLNLRSGRRTDYAVILMGNAHASGYCAGSSALCRYGDQRGGYGRGPVGNVGAHCCGAGPLLNVLAFRTGNDPDPESINPSNGRLHQLFERKRRRSGRAIPGQQQVGGSVRRPAQRHHRSGDLQ